MARTRQNRRPYLAWTNDADYLAKLSPEDRQFYERFIGEYYRNATLHAVLDKDTRRERWRAYQANRRDLLTRHRVDPQTALDGGVLPNPPAPPSENDLIDEIDQDDALARAEQGEDTDWEPE